MTRPDWIYGPDGVLAKPEAWAAQASPSEHVAPWPGGVLMRFTTLGGSHVDVTGSGDHTEDNAWHCRGCLLDSERPAKDFLFRIRTRANDHASICRAVPKPEGTA